MRGWPLQVYVSHGGDLPGGVCPCGICDNEVFNLALVGLIARLRHAALPVTSVNKPAKRPVTNQWGLIMMFVPFGVMNVSLQLVHADLIADLLAEPEDFRAGHDADRPIKLGNLVLVETGVNLP